MPSLFRFSPGTGLLTITRLEALVEALDGELQARADLLLDAQAVVLRPRRPQVRIAEQRQALGAARRLREQPDAALEGRGRGELVARRQPRIERPAIDVAEVVDARARNQRQPRRRAARRPRGKRPVGGSRTGRGAATVCRPVSGPKASGSPSTWLAGGPL